MAASAGEFWYEVFQRLLSSADAAGVASITASATPVPAVPDKSTAAPAEKAIAGLSQTLNSPDRSVSRYDFFIAYATPDRKQAQNLCWFLQDDSCKVFLDEEAVRLGALWQPTVREALEASRAIVVLVSTHADDAFYQQEEILRAIELTRDKARAHTVIPVILEQLPQGALNMPYGLNRLQARDATRSGGLQRVAADLVAWLIEKESQLNANQPKVADEIGFRPPQSERSQIGKHPLPVPALFQWYASRSQSGTPGVPPMSMVSRDLKILCDAIATQYCGVLFMLDEAHRLGKSLDLTQQLRHVFRESSQCGLIFAGERELSQMFTDPSAPFYLQARVIPVGNFMTKSDIAECALLPLAENERPLMSPMTVDHLYRLSHGKPNQIRLICHSIYRRYLKNEQRDLNIAIEALDEVLDNIQASYEAEYDLKKRVDMIKRLPSVDLEILYLITRYPEWHPQDVIALDEAFRGEKTSVRAMNRRDRRLKEKWKTFVDMGLLQDNTDRYMLAGDEFLQLYLRFFYEVRKYGNLSRQLNLGEGQATPFGEKAEKLIRSLAWEVERRPSVVKTTMIEADAERADVISEVRHRCVALESVLRGEPTELGASLDTVLESLSLCQLIAKHAQYYLLVIAVRNMENPRESLLVEMYFETGEPLVFPLTLLTEQAEAAGILVEAFDKWFVELPTLEEFVKGVSGHTLDELIAHSGAVAQWMVRAIQKLVEEEKPPKEETQEENEEDEKSDWLELYRKQKSSEAVEAITTQLGDNPRRTVAARLQNDRGYIRYEIEGQAENAKHDLERAVALHHSKLAITLLNLSVIAIDNRDYAQAIEKIEDALLITHGRESVDAAYLGRVAKLF